MASAGDTVIAKLEWAVTGDSERRLRDVAGVVAVQCEGLDQDCVVHWVHALGLESEWRRALALAGDP